MRCAGLFLCSLITATEEFDSSVQTYFNYTTHSACHLGVELLSGRQNNKMPHLVQHFESLRNIFL